MSAESKATELKEEEIQQASGGDDPDCPKYDSHYWYEKEVGGISCVVHVVNFDGHRNGKNYYNVQYKIILGIYDPLRHAVLSEEELTRKVALNSSGQIIE